jgi:hypothetical protein
LLTVFKVYVQFSIVVIPISRDRRWAWILQNQSITSPITNLPLSKVLRWQNFRL